MRTKNFIWGYQRFHISLLDKFVAKLEIGTGSIDWGQLSRRFTWLMQGLVSEILFLNKKHDGG
jgi:hypothetical protein